MVEDADHMAVAEFVRAVISDQDRADLLLATNPALREGHVQSESIMVYLATEGYTEAIRFLCERGFVVDGPGDTALITAVAVGATDVARVLLEHGANVNAQSEIWDCPLHQAVSSGKVEMVSLLLEHGAERDYRTTLGETWEDVLPNKAEKQRLIRQLFT